MSIKLTLGFLLAFAFFVSLPMLLFGSVNVAVATLCGLIAGKWLTFAFVHFAQTHPDLAKSVSEMWV